MKPTSMFRRGASFISALGIAAIACTAATSASAATVPEPTDVIGLSWNGQDYTSMIGGSFVGVPVSVPGDSARRTLMVRNDGPSSGTLSASIINVKILDQDAADHGNFYNDLRLGWDGGSSTFTALAAKPETQIYEIPLAQGAVVPLTIDYRFPVEATSGNQANVSRREASFDVKLTISGDAKPTLPGTETTAPPTEPPAVAETPTPEPSVPETSAPEPSAPEPSTSEPTKAPGTENVVPPATTDPTATPPPLEGTQQTLPPIAKPPLANTGASIWGPVAAGLGLLGLGALASARGKRKAKHSN